MITIKSLPYVTEQEVFDQVAKHLLLQNKASMKKDVQCSYRGDEGLKCAAGCLIGDDEYNEEFEGLIWEQLVERNLAPKDHQGLIYSLQLIHDNFEPETWHSKLKSLAKNSNLKFNF